MFTSSRIYSVTSFTELLGAKTIEDKIAKLETMLSEFVFKPCMAQDVSKVGFTQPFIDRGDGLIFSVGEFLVGAVKFQDKKLPASFINDQVSAKAQEYLEQNGNKPSKKQRNEWKEEIATSFLPNVIPVSKVIRFCFDTEAGIIYVDTSSSSKAEDILALIRKAIGSLPALPFFDANKLDVALQEYGQNKSMPEKFQLGSKIRFQSCDEEKATSNFKNIDIMAPDVQSQFEDKRCTMLELENKDSISFTIKNDGTLSQVKLNDEMFTDNEEDALPGRIMVSFKVLRETLDALGAKPEKKEK
jgi:recombination associated protein RdgC